MIIEIWREKNHRLFGIFWRRSTGKFSCWIARFFCQFCKDRPQGCSNGLHIGQFLPQKSFQSDRKKLKINLKFEGRSVLYRRRQHSESLYHLFPLCIGYLFFIKHTLRKKLMFLIVNFFGCLTKRWCDHKTFASPVLLIFSL